MPAAAAYALDRLHVSVGAAAPLRRVRHPALSAGLRELARGRSAAELPPLLASVLTLCAEQHRITARRALHAAAGLPQVPAVAREEACYLRAACLREHLVRIGSGWPLAPLTPPNAAAAVTAGLSGIPHVPPTRAPGERVPQLLASLKQLIAHAEQRVLGMTASLWLQHYGLHDSHGVRRWARNASESLAPAAALAGIHARASALTLQLPRASLSDHPQRDLPRLAAAVRADPRLCEHAELSGERLESGPFSRAAWPHAQRRHAHAFDLLAARILDVAQLCVSDAWLTSGALPLGPGEAIAYTELARGLLIHWVQLSLPELRAGRAVVQDYRILTPTDFALHPRGALATALTRTDLTIHDAQLLLAAFDPCLDVALTDTREALRCTS